MVTTHVLDLVTGRPAAGMAVRLETVDGAVVGQGRTDEDGRLRDLGAPDAGTYRLVFGTGDWCASAGRQTFYPEVVVTFSLGEGHHHVPLLLSAYGYSTYRGS